MTRAALFLALLAGAAVVSRPARAAETVASLNPKMAIVYPRSAQGVALMIQIADLMASSRTMDGGLGAVYFHQSTVTLALANLRAGEVKIHLSIKALEHHFDGMTAGDFPELTGRIDDLTRTLGQIGDSDTRGRLRPDAPAELRAAAANRYQYGLAILADINILRFRVAALKGRFDAAAHAAAAARAMHGYLGGDGLAAPPEMKGGEPGPRDAAARGPFGPARRLDDRLVPAPARLYVPPPRSARVNGIFAQITAAYAEARGGAAAPAVADPHPANERAPIRWLDDAASAQVLGQTRFLRPAELDAVRVDALGLSPRYAAKVRNADYFLSPPFTMDGGRLGVAALVSVNGSTTTHIFYRSGSQGVWALCEAATVRNGSLGHYGKGFSESDVHLPLEITSLLHRISTTTVPVAFAAASSSETVFRGMVEISSANLSYEGGVYVSSAYALSVSSVPRAFAVPRENLRAYAAPVPDPARVLLPPALQLPDYKRPIDGYVYTNASYAAVNGNGTMNGVVYASKDGNIHYLFVEDSAGRAAMVGAEDANVDISSFGVKTSFLQQKGMDAPLIDYYFQIPYADIPAGGLHPHPYYRSNWNYVRRLPIIVQYYGSRGRGVPPALPAPSAQELVVLLMGKLRADFPAAGDRALYLWLDGQLQASLPVPRATAASAYIALVIPPAPAMPAAVGGGGVKRKRGDP